MPVIESTMYAHYVLVLGETGVQERVFEDLLKILGKSIIVAPRIFMFKVLYNYFIITITCCSLPMTMNRQSLPFGFMLFQVIDARPLKYGHCIRTMALLTSLTKIENHE